MKRSLLFFTICACCLSSFCQTRSEALVILRAEVIKAQKKLPIGGGEAISLRSIQIQGKDFIMSYNLDENQMDYDNFIKYMMQDRSRMLSLVRGRQSNEVSILAKSGLNLKYIITGKHSKKKRVLSLSNSEVSQLANAEYTAADYMAKYIQTVRKQLPMDFGEGLMYTDIYVEGKYVCYCFEASEDEIDGFMRLRDNEVAYKKLMFDLFMNPDDPTEALFIRSVRERGFGIKQIYKGELTGRVVIFSLTPYEVKNLSFAEQ